MIAVEVILRHERAVVAAGVTAVVALAWWYVWDGAGMGMPALDMTRATLFPHRYDVPGELEMTVPVVVLMWWVMMVAIMTPSAAPLVLLYTRVARHHAAEPSIAPAALLAAGYLLAWLLFSLAAHGGAGAAAAGGATVRHDALVQIGGVVGYRAGRGRPVPAEPAQADLSHALPFAGDSFRLGQSDSTCALALSDRLYRPEREIESIEAALLRARAGRTELLLVSGGSGSGKSALVHQLRRPVAERGGLFLAGKLEQLGAGGSVHNLSARPQAAMRLDRNGARTG